MKQKEQNENPIVCSFAFGVAFFLKKKKTASLIPTYVVAELSQSRNVFVKVGYPVLSVK
jgi:hypothetical protein